MLDQLLPPRPARPRRAAALPLALALALAACGSSDAPSTPSASTLLQAPVDGSPQRGPADAWVTIVEFADFECPFCRDEAPVLSAVLAAYPADARLVFKYLPLRSIHRYAQAAAVAAACAAEQGRFWELHDLLFTTALDDATLVADAQQVQGLDLAAWQACRDATTAPAPIAADVALAARAHVNGTPTLFVNGARVEGGAVDEATLRAAVERALTTAVASGIPRAEYYSRAVLGR